MANGKCNKNAYELKAMILMNNGLPVTIDNLQKLDELWDSSGRYSPDNIKNVINSIKAVKHY